VFGTRLFGANTMYLSYRHAMGNRSLTLAANLLFNAYLSDMHTCLKLLPLQLFKMMELEENGFGLDTEITAKILQLGLRPFEIPVSYHSRSFAHGKKISWRHGVECLWVLARVRFGRTRRLELKNAVWREGGDSPAVEAELEAVGSSNSAG
jgi:dolichol-phosphate hexosyltransferase